MCPKKRKFLNNLEKPRLVAGGKLINTRERGRGGGGGKYAMNVFYIFLKIYVKCAFIHMNYTISDQLVNKQTNNNKNPAK